MRKPSLEIILIISSEWSPETGKLLNQSLSWVCLELTVGVLWISPPLTGSAVDHPDSLPPTPNKWGKTNYFSMFNGHNVHEVTTKKCIYNTIPSLHQLYPRHTPGIILNTSLNSLSPRLKTAIPSLWKVNIDWIRCKMGLVGIRYFLQITGI